MMPGPLAPKEWNRWGLLEGDRAVSRSPAPGAPSCLRKAWQKTLFEGLTEGRKGVDKVTEDWKYQGRGQENREGAGSLRTSHSHRNKLKEGKP